MHKFFKKSHIGSLGLIFLIGFIVYSNSLFNPFVWDDNALIVNNDLIKDTKYFFKIFTTHIGSKIIPTNSYRPLQMVSYMFDYHLWGLNTLGYHLTNIFLHIAAALLAYLLIFILSKNVLISLITSLFFVVHPLSVEVVTFVSGRADILVALFLLASLILFIRYSEYNGARRTTFYCASVLCFILALLSKENAIIFPIILIVFDFILRPVRLKTIKNFVNRHITFLLIDLIYINLRLTVFKFVPGHLEIVKFPLCNRFLVFLKAIMTYLRVLILPLDMHMNRMVIVPRSIFRLEAFLSLVGILSLIFLIVLSYKRSKLTCFFAIWFFVFLIPQSGIYPINAFLADHFLYLPCIGFFFIFTTLLEKAFSRKIFLSIIILFLIFLSFTTFKQNQLWGNEELLYKHILKFSPYSVQAHNNLGLFYAENDRKEEALKEYQLATKFMDDFFLAQKNIANVYFRMEKFEKSIKKNQEILKKFPEKEAKEKADIHNSMGASYAALKRYKDALEQFRLALSLKPDFTSANFNIAQVYLQQGKTRKSVEEMLLILNLDIKPADLLNSLKPTLNEYLKIIRTKKTMMNVLLELGIIFSKYSHYDMAEQAFKEAIKLEPEYADAYYNLGALYFRMGDIVVARRMFKKALRLDPSNTYAKEWLLRTER
ncbi:MAG: tetratricopeptide repeat protein [Candidatus Omnitrophota bacterium]